LLKSIAHRPGLGRKPAAPVRGIRIRPSVPRMPPSSGRRCGSSRVAPKGAGFDSRAAHQPAVG